MHRRHLLVAAAGVGAALLSGAASAQSSLDGTWVGATPRGSALSISISGGQVTAYYFQGRAQGISGGRFSGNRATVSVSGPNQGKIALSKGKGDGLSYSYTDNTGPGAATATLTKQ